MANYFRCTYCLWRHPVFFIHLFFCVVFYNREFLFIKLWNWFFIGHFHSYFLQIIHTLYWKIFAIGFISKILLSEKCLKFSWLSILILRAHSPSCCRRVCTPVHWLSVQSSPKEPVNHLFISVRCATTGTHLMHWGTRLRTTLRNTWGSLGLDREHL